MRRNGRWQISPLAQLLSGARRHAHLVVLTLPRDLAARRRPYKSSSNSLVEGALSHTAVCVKGSPGASRRSPSLPTLDAPFTRSPPPPMYGIEAYTLRWTAKMGSYS